MEVIAELLGAVIGIGLVFLFVYSICKLIAGIARRF